MTTSAQMITTGLVDHPVNIYYQRKTLTRVIPALVYAKFLQHDKVPQSEGDTTKWRRWSNILAQTTPLTEGEDPAPILIVKTDLSSTVVEYGAWTQTSTWKDFTGIAQDKDSIADVLMDNMAITIDTLARAVVAGTASRTTASNGSGTATLINKTDLDTIIWNLRGQNCKMINPTVSATTGIGTAPVRKGYIGIAHTDVGPSIQNVSGFQHVSTYAEQGARMDDELGATGDIRWLVTSNGLNDGTNYDNVIFGEDFAGDVKIDGNTANRPLVFTPSTQTGSPLQRYSTLGWVANYVARILNDNFGHALRTTV